MKTASHKIKLLRLWGESANISANVFDHLFRENIGSLFCTDYMSSQKFAALATEKSVLLEALRSYDYICPDYRMMAAAPWMMHLRHQNGLSFGIIFITHSPGIYGMEWYLMRPLIRPKDIIIAPSRFSANVIKLLAPALESNVEIINHPMDLKENQSETSRRGNKIVTLSRIAEGKLIHRQIDAMAIIVHTLGYDHLKMVIGGSLKDSDSDEPTSYARLLHFKIKQLNLEQHVFLAGEISAQEKKAFFKEAFVSVNLSRTLEEGFPKAGVEALSFGIPVVATRWNGFSEIVGSAGILLELELDHAKADLVPAELAKAIIALYENAVDRETCLRRIQPYDVSILRKRYREVVSSRASRSTGTDHAIESSAGLLDTLSFLKVFTHAELMTYHCEWVETYFNSLKNTSGPVRMNELFFRFFIDDAVKEILTGFYAFKYSADMIAAFTLEDAGNAYRKTEDFREKIRQSIYLSNNLHSKKTLLKIFSERPDRELLQEAMRHFNQTEEGIPEPDYFIPYADYLGGKYSAVCRFYKDYFSSRQPKPDQVEQLCLWSKSALKCNETAEIITYLTQWLKRFTAEPEALPIHVFFLKFLIHAPDVPDKRINRQFELINELCFDRTLARHLEVLAYAG
jgi:glycosyltransferase involved in cell wall biosynthesis